MQESVRQKILEFLDKKNQGTAKEIRDDIHYEKGLPVKKGTVNSI